jgi:protein PhnA
MVKNITIPADVEGHIEGRVNGTKIYLKTEFLKKA